jgi:hypothetical protein
MGYKALYTSNGDNNTAFGHNAGTSTTSGSQNVFIGGQCAVPNTTGGYNTAVGANSFATNTTGSYNTAIGYSALNASTTADSNTAVGYNALTSTTTGTINTALGTDALYFNTTASNNTAVGYRAGFNNTTGTCNTFVGQAAGYNSNYNGNAGNSCFGIAAGYSLTTGIKNTFLGGNANYGSGYYVTTGSNNTILGPYHGNQGGLDIRTASNYIVLSDGDGEPQGYCNNYTQWVLGKGGSGAAYDGTLILNGSSATSYGSQIAGRANGTTVWQIGSYSSIFSGTNQYFTCVNTSGGVYLNGGSATSWSAVSDETRKVIIEPITGGLDKIATLRTVIGRLKTDDESVRRPYLIAQDVQAVLPEAVSESKDKEGVVLGLSYTEVIPLLVNAIQELKAEFDAYKATHS